jgi:hypothetical protein
MKSKKLARLMLITFSLVGLQFPSTAYAQDVMQEKEPKVYFEKECLALFSAHRAPAALADNETKVEETRTQISFDKLTVTESRDGAIVDTYIQVRHCRPVEASEHL